MATAICLFNGLHVPIPVIDRAMSWSKAHGGELIALFVLADKDQDEGYPFPNDLDEAEHLRNDTEAMGTDLAVIASHIRLIRHEAAMNSIKLTTQILPDPSKKTLQHWLEKAALLFVSNEPLDPPVLSVDPSEIADALHGLGVALERVNAD